MLLPATQGLLEATRDVAAHTRNNLAEHGLFVQGNERSGFMANMLATAARGILCLQILAVGMAIGAEESRKVPDPTPPPLGTASFVPPANIDEQPLNSQSFVVQAALVHMTEIEIGTVAQSKSATPAVRKFGARLVADHGGALANLKKVAAEARIALPAELDPEHQALRDELNRLDGPAFDAKFASATVGGHESAINLFKLAASSDALTPALRSYAQSALPTLRQHAQIAHQLQM